MFRYGCSRGIADKFSGMESGASEKREIRPFPAIDPEPDHRLHWPRLSARRALVGAGVIVAAGVLTAGGLVGYHLASAPSGRAKATATAAPVKAFAIAGGLVVFEEQPSGLLGTARADGSGVLTDSEMSGLQGNDLPVASADGRHLADGEGDLVTVGAKGPDGVSPIGTPDTAVADAGGTLWEQQSFANGGANLAVTECDPDSITGGQPFVDSELVTWLIPLSGGKAVSLGLTDSATAVPDADAVLAALPADLGAAQRQITCSAGELADSALDRLAPGKPAKTVATAAALARAAGLPAGTPVTLSLGGTPSPDGRWVLVGVRQALPGGATREQRLNEAPGAALLVNTATGQVTGRLTPGQEVTWSPDGTQLASCRATLGAAQVQQTTVTVQPVSASGRPGAARTIPLGRRDVACDQLLWSPDGTQLLYSGLVTQHGLTQADDLQRGWTLIDLKTGAVRNVTAPGQPVAWIKGAGE
jgi:hypothetical protein